MPKRKIGPMFLKNRARLRLNPAPKISKGSIKVKKRSDSNSERSPKNTLSR